MQEIKDALERYVKHKVPTGGFLQAVLENDLQQACAKADHINQFRIWEIVHYCWNHVPAQAWGSREAVRTWLGHG